MAVIQDPALGGGGPHCSLLQPLSFPASPGHLPSPCPSCDSRVHTQDHDVFPQVPGSHHFHDADFLGPPGKLLLQLCREREPVTSRQDPGQANSRMFPVVGIMTRETIFFFSLSQETGSGPQVRKHIHRDTSFALQISSWGPEGSHGTPSVSLATMKPFSPERQDPHK